MSDEKEHVALGILYCSIKYFFIENKQIDNPFYIPFDSKNSQLKLDYDHVYNNYIKLLKIKFDGNLDKQNEEKLLQEFVKKYLALYKNHVKNNPFNLTIDQLKKQYPEFMSNLAKQYVEPTTAPTFFPEHQTLEKTIEKITNHVFSLHAYVLSKPQHDCVTVYEDDYAKPCYDN
ncbi:MAG: hypothetical protein ACD_46C00186G0004 [uncultured bacterium]|nr:MAG: hypothetical protein ACD_46C00186G0004 [uncultured bacterium]